MNDLHRLKTLKESLLCAIEEEMLNICEADTDELGKVIDMVKDIEKTIYYCTITHAMNNEETTDHATVHSTDTKEGRSAHVRKSYLEAKEKHEDKALHLRELEKYMQELTTDIVEMITDASIEEKAYLEKKIMTLAAKIGQMK